MRGGGAPKDAPPSSCHLGAAVLALALVVLALALIILLLALIVLALAVARLALFLVLTVLVLLVSHRRFLLWSAEGRIRTTARIGRRFPVLWPPERRARITGFGVVFDGPRLDLGARKHLLLARLQKFVLGPAEAPRHQALAA